MNGPSAVRNRTTLAAFPPGAGAGAAPTCGEGKGELGPGGATLRAGGRAPRRGSTGGAGHLEKGYSVPRRDRQRASLTGRSGRRLGGRRCLAWRAARPCCDARCETRGARRAVRTRTLTRARESRGGPERFSACDEPRAAVAHEEGIAGGGRFARSTGAPPMVRLGLAREGHGAAKWRAPGNIVPVLAGPGVIDSASAG